MRGDSRHHPPQPGHGRSPLRTTWVVSVLALVTSACGGGGIPEIDPGTEPGGTAIAPACDEVDELVAAVPDEPDPERDGDPATAGEAPPDLGQQLQQWGEQEAADSFAGLWVDQDLGGYAVAFVEDVERYAEEVRERFHPGIAVAEAENTYAELRDTQDRISQQEAGVVDGEPGDVRFIGAQVMINRTTVGLFDPDEQRLAELSETYGATTICFEIEQPPGPVAEGLEPLVKASGWRDGLQTDAFAVIEIADDREAAQRAWRDNVPDDLEPRDDELPAEPGLYRDLDEVDFDRQAIVVWSSGESGSCPGWLADIDTRDGVVHVERDATEQTCTDDYNPYRMLFAVDRDRLPPADELPHARLDGVPDGEIRSYPDDG
jgi:hypothetical protein